MNLGIAGLEWVSTIGSGGFGQVHRARDDAHGRDVAVKILHGSADEAGRLRFDRERRLMGSLSNHPHIVSIHTSGYTESGSPYIVMELVPGGSLGDRLKQGALSATETIRIGRHLSAALCAAHDAGVLHLDIKPENVLLDAGGEPMLTDFGIASSVTEVSLRNTISVSPAYSAPEALNDFDVDARTDVYSLAATLYTCATGLRPYQVGDEGVLATLGRMATDLVPTITDPAIPPAFGDLLARAMAKDPAGRPASMQAFADQLAALDISGHDAPHTVSVAPTASVGAPSSNTVDRGSKPAAPASQRKIMLAAAFGVLAIAIGAATLLAVRATRGDSADQPDRQDEPSTELVASEQPASTPTPPPTPVPTATVPPTPTAEPIPPPSVVGPTAFAPLWSLGRTDDFAPVEQVLTVPLGTPSMCLFWEYDGVDEGSSFDARWFAAGIYNEENSVLDGATPGSPGSFFACFDDPNGVPGGWYEVEWWIEDVLIFSEQMFVGDGIPNIDVVVLNEAPVDVCGVFFAPNGASTYGLDELGRVLPAGESGSIRLPLGTYAVVAIDCEGNVRFEDAVGTELFDGITLTII